MSTDDEHEQSRTARVSLVAAERADRNADTATAHDPRPTPTFDAHAHAHADDRNEAYGAFPHEKLDAYQVALRMAGLAKALAEAIPQGHRNLADHLLRAATNTVLFVVRGRSGSASSRAGGSARR